MNGGAGEATGVKVDDPFAELRGFCDGVPAPDKDEFAMRRAQVVQAMIAAKVDAVVVEAGVQMRYLTGVGWGLSERPLLYILDARGRGRWVGPSFERGTLGERLAAQGQDEGTTLDTWDEHESPYALVAKSAGLAGGRKRVALDPAMRGFVADGLRSAIGSKGVGIEPAIVDAVRMVKSPKELARLRRANEATKAALRVAARLIEPGMTEADARPIIHDAQVAAGLSQVWVLALFGPNAAFPHGTSTAHQLAEGEFALVDTGGSLHGYQSDITRTWAYGQVPDPARRAWDAVLAAQRESLETMRPGSQCGQVDAKAREVIAKAGFGQGYANFTHRLGHGIGLQGHEAPYLRMNNERVLRPGMTMSNEPGIYVPGAFGVRIEDIVAITDEGFEVFGPRPTSLEQPFGAAT